MTNGYVTNKPYLGAIVGTMTERNNRFNLIPGDGRNIIYLNGEEVFAPVPLKAYDLIDFGEAKLLFVPLCGEHFTWKQEEDSHGTDQ